MRRNGWAAGALLGAMAAMVATLATGCGTAGDGGSADASAKASAQASTKASAPASASTSGGSASPAVTGAFGKEQAAADVVAATAAADLGQSGETATATPDPADPKAKRRAEVLACAAPWQTTVPAGDAVKAYEATIATLEQRGWKRGERRQVDMLTQTTLTKQGWTVLARRYDFSGGKGAGMGMPDMLSFMATDQACAERFTDAELEDAFKDDEAQG
ncbi:hypothetical protein OHA37_27360 [Streptomyces sp. NBC_00335]|uniref:hypothetical protein n=1 Tax=unclassified Streptomyces TaxID=2593676 RepID=UPI00225258E6|nr:MULTISPECIES: hypothetical protein [unclassified Streptomyces]MCX5407568.1 hypothetical protein [Streptomyces sp. NBC_00086]